MHTDFSGRRSGGLVFPSFEEFSIICCDPHSQRLLCNEAEVDVSLEFSWFFYDPVDVGNLISDSSAFPKFSLNIWKFSVHILLKTSLENFEHDFAGMWNECNYAVVCTFFGITLVRDWNGNWPATPASFGFSNTLSCLSSQELQTWGSLNLDYFPFQLCAWLAFLYLLL